MDQILRPRRRKYHLRYDADAIREAIAGVDKATVVALFIELAVIADLSKREEKELCVAAAELSGTSTQTIAAALANAREGKWLRPVDPTYPNAAYSEAAEARSKTRDIVRDFFNTSLTP